MPDDIQIAYCPRCDRRAYIAGTMPEAEALVRLHLVKADNEGLASHEGALEQWDAMTAQEREEAR